MDDLNYIQNKVNLLNNDNVSIILNEIKKLKQLVNNLYINQSKKIKLKDLFDKYNYKWNEIKFNYNYYLYCDHLCIGIDIYNNLVCDWRLDNTCFESIFINDNQYCNWFETIDILNVNVYINTFNITENEIANLLWNKIIEFNYI